MRNEQVRERARGRLLIAIQVGPRAARAQATPRATSRSRRASVAAKWERRTPLPGDGTRGLPVHQPRLLDPKVRPLIDDGPCFARRLKWLTGIFAEQPPDVLSLFRGVQAARRLAALRRGLATCQSGEGSPMRRDAVRRAKVAGPPPDTPDGPMRHADGRRFIERLQVAGSLKHEDACPKGDVDSLSPHGPIQRRIAFREPKGAEEC